MSENLQESNNTAPATPAPDAAAPATPPADPNLGYKDTSNQDAAGYSEHKPAEPAPKTEFKFNKEGHDEKTIGLVESYAEVHGLNEKQVQGFADFVKNLKTQSETAKIKAAETAKRESHEAMQRDFKTLKDHPEFGKDLEKSFMEVNQVLDLIPDVKKMLTADGKRVDPVLAIGLKSLHSKLYGQDGLIVQGGKTDPQSNLPVWDQIYGVRK